MGPEAYFLEWFRKSRTRSRGSTFKLYFEMYMLMYTFFLYKKLHFRGQASNFLANWPFQALSSDIKVY